MKRIIPVILYWLFAIPVFGAFSSTAIWRVSTVSSSDNNGGAFDPGVGSPGTDESSSAGVAITVTLTGAGTTGTCSPSCTSTTHGPGNFIRIASGSGCTTATTYEILSQSAGTITLDKSMGSSTDICVGVIGGPLASPNTALGLEVGSNTICVKNDGVYSISSGLTGAPAGTLASPTAFQGYASTCPINDGGQVTIRATSGSFTIMGTGNDNQRVLNVIFDCNSQTSSTGLSINANNLKADKILVTHCGTRGISLGSGGGHAITNTRVTAGLSGCTAGIDMSGAASGMLLGVLVDTNQCVGVISGSSQNFSCYYAVSANNTGASSDGFQMTTANADLVQITNCAAYANGRDGFRFTNNNGPASGTVRNSWAWGNAGKSFNASAASATSDTLLLDYSAYASGSLNNITAGVHDIALTSDPTDNGASLDFSLNSTTGGGAALKAAGFPGSLFGSTGFLSVGPIQPQVNNVSAISGAFGFVQ